MLELLTTAFSAALDPHNLLIVVFGVFVGIIFGCIPGLSTNGCIALCMPITYAMTMQQGICMMMGIYIGGTSGGLISAILLNIPGTPAAMATTFDGHPMARNGQAGKALGTGVVFSFFGGLVSMIALMFIAPFLASITLKFSAVEYFAATIFSICMIAGLSGGSLAKGLAAGIIGIAISLVGTTPVEYLPRFTFGFYQLNEGFAMTSVIIGCFAIPEVVDAIKGKNNVTKADLYQCKIKGFGITLKEFFGQIKNFVISAIIGTSIGILPGIGGSTASPLAYTAVKYSSKEPEKFGTGIIDGVVASETANNAVVGGALIPMLTLGIPGDTVTALIMSALTLYGLNCGPLLFTTNPDALYLILAALFVANVIMIFMEIGGIRFFAKMLTLPKYYLFPIVVVLCGVGAYCTNHRTFDVLCLIAFGFVGYVMRLAGLPFAPMIIGYVLGEMVETYLRRALMIYDDNFLAFFSRPIADGFFAAALVVVVVTIISQRKRKSKQ